MARRNFPDEIKRRVSYKKKAANSFKRQKDLADYYDTFYGDFRNADDIEKMQINYDLYNGRLDEKLYDAPISFTAGNEEVFLEQNEINHYPFISQVANAMYGEAIARPFRPIAKEKGSLSQTAKKKKYTELLREYLDREILAPIQQQVQQQYFTEMGITDPFSLAPEQQQQAMAEMGARIQAKTPAEILDFMENDFQTPTQRQAQQLTDYLVQEKRIREVQNEGFKHAIITGKEYYYIGDRNGEPVMELVNPMYFQWGGSQNTVWVQDGDWAKHEQWITFEQAVQKYGEHFKRNDWKMLEEYAEPIGGFRNMGDPKYDRVQEKAMYILSEENGYVAQHFEDVNVRTREGQQSYMGLYNALSRRWGKGRHGGLADYGIREAHVTWADFRKLYRITKVIDRKPVKFWVDEHYVRQPEDIEMHEVWVKEVWEATILGSFDRIYTNVRPVPNQYKSIHNPHDVQLPYYGREYNTHMNNSRNIAPIDLGKPFQKEIDVLMAQIRHEMATDIGKVFVAVMGMKPDGWKWSDWMSTMKTGRILALQPDKHGQSPFDANMMKAVDLSRTADIAAKVSLLEALKQNLIQAMFFNNARMGAVGQYATSETTAVNQTASYNQTEAFFDTHRQIVEGALNALVNRAKHVYRDQPHKLDYIFDDVARADLELTQGLWNSELGIDTSLKHSDVQKVELLRSQMMTLAQNGMSMEGIMQLALAETTSDILALFQKEQRKIEQARQEAMQQQQAIEQQKLQADLQKTQMEQQFDAAEADKDRAVSLERTRIQSYQWQLQADVNNNQIADSIERTNKELEFKREELAEKSRLKDRELDIKSTE
jgi:hypothetical protein